MEALHTVRADLQSTREDIAGSTYQVLQSVRLFRFPIVTDILTIARIGNQIESDEIRTREFAIASHEHCSGMARAIGTHLDSAIAVDVATGATPPTRKWPSLLRNSAMIAVAVPTGLSSTVVGGAGNTGSMGGKENKERVGERELGRSTGMKMSVGQGKPGERRAVRPLGGRILGERN